MIKKGELKEAVKEIFTHQKKHVVLYVIEIIVIVALIAVLVMQKDVALRGVVVNASDSAPNEAYSTLSDELLLGTQLDPAKKKVELMGGVYYIMNEEDSDDSKKENNYTFIQALVQQTDEGNLDFMTGDLETMTNLAYSSFFVELSEVLSEEQMKLYEPYLLYIDLAVVEQLKKASESSNYDVEINIPDCTKPEEMEKPVAILLDMSKCESLAALYPDTEGPIVFAVLENTEHKATLKTLIESLIGK